MELGVIIPVRSSSISHRHGV